ncbi:MAG TPA: permease prefix domain 1-containing protein [Fimbriimonadaceae bacterium]|jgi:hypothetical protein
MSTPIDQYLLAIEKKLKQRISSDRRTQIINEMRAHLTIAQKELMAQGLAEEGASRLAVQRFGESEVVAGELVRQHTGVNTKSAWKLVWLPLLLLVASTVLFVALYLPGRHFYWYPVSRGLQALSLVTFLAMVARSRRWLLTPMIAALLVLSISSACLAAWVGFGAPNAASSKSAQLAILDQREQIRGELAYAHAARMAVEEGKPVPFGAVYRANNGLPESKAPLVPVLNRQVNAYMVWGMPVSVNTRDIVDLDPAEPGVDAVAIWRRDGAAAEAGLRDLREEFDHYASAVSSEKFDAMFFSNSLKRQMVGAVRMALVNAFVLAFLNGLFLWLAALSDRLQGKRTARSFS